MADTTTDPDDGGDVNLDAPQTQPQAAAPTQSAPADTAQQGPTAAAQPARSKGLQLDDSAIRSYGDNGDGTWTLVDHGGKAITIHGDPGAYGLHPPQAAKQPRGADSISYEEPGDIKDALNAGLASIKSLITGQQNPYTQDPSKTPLPGQQDVQPTPEDRRLTPSTAPTPPSPAGASAAAPKIKEFGQPPAFGSNWRKALADFISPTVLPTPAAGSPASATQPNDTLITPSTAPSGAGPVDYVEQLRQAVAAKRAPFQTFPAEPIGATPPPASAPEDAGKAWAAQNLDNAGAPVVPPGGAPPPVLTSTVTPTPPSPEQTAAIANAIPPAGTPAQGVLSPEQRAQLSSLLAPPPVPAGAPLAVAAPSTPTPPVATAGTSPVSTIAKMATGASPPAANPFGAPTAEAKSAVDQQAAAEAQQNDALAKVASDTTAQLGNLNSQFTRDAGDDVAAAGDRLAKYDSLADAAADAAKNFDPNKFWSTRSTGQMLAIGIGSAFGSFSKALGGTDTSSEILGKAIDNAARGEETKLNSQWKSAETAAKGLDMQNELSSLRRASLLTTRSNIIDLAKQKIDEETLKTSNPLIIAKANAMKAQLSKEQENDGMRWGEYRNALANSASQRGLTQQQTIAAKLTNAGTAATLPSEISVKLGQLGATQEQYDFGHIGGYDPDPVKKQAAEQVWLKDHPAIPALLPGQNLEALGKMADLQGKQLENAKTTSEMTLPGGGLAAPDQVKVARGIDTGIRSVAPLLTDLDKLSGDWSIGPINGRAIPWSTPAQTEFGAKAQGLSTQLISALGETARENPELWKSLSPQIPLPTDRPDTIKTKTRAMRQILQDAAHGSGSRIDYFPELKVRPR